MGFRGCWKRREGRIDAIRRRVRIRRGDGERRRGREIEEL